MELTQESVKMPMAARMRYTATVNEKITALKPYAIAAVYIA